ncbi:unnamed protein product (macronuclear) [Paramecium tetraurelia]|uniref:Protein kinase domain containing protein n=1 Tax=Paramecium tetraurelia TaxID=5888 RepID=A0DX71_PARTE|nr:uncharacterized protein GSPATT00021270001 [Paramecium tetraurelia]CAK87638.1 unnamed protein product [Paramecium tetraurelia]|eukprot:XP_001455035.1 hypothetical protein (macronuclear) [Paramecium tetraurelia strain d4-2]
MGACHAVPKSNQTNNSKNENSKSRRKIPSASAPVSPKAIPQKSTFSQKKLTHSSNCPQQLLKLHKVAISQHYSVIYEKVPSKNLNANQSFVQNNLNGKIRIVETLPKSVPEHSEYINKLLTHNLNHPNLIKIFDIYEDIDTYKIIFENYTGGILYMKNDGIGMLEETAGTIIKQIIDVIHYLHQHKLIHGNLQLSSFAYNDQKDQNTIKLIDVKSIFVKEPITITNALYTSPEGFREQDIKAKPRDVWSIGVIAHFLLTGFLPFKGATVPKIYADVRRGILDMSSIQFDKISSESKEFLSNILVVSPANRMDLLSLTKTNWMIKQKKRFENKIKVDLQNMRKLKKMSLLQYCILQYMVNQYLSEQSSSLFQTFNDIDANKDGKITKYELMNAYQKLYENYEDAFQVVSEIFSNVDQDENGEIEIQEYILALTDRKSLLTEDNLKDTFRVLSNRKGHITIQSLILQINVKEELIEAEFVKLQKKNISFQDFKLYMAELI